MMVLSPALTNRLEDVWIRLQRMLYQKGISQIDLDTNCICWLETAVTLEEELIEDGKK